MKQNHKQWAALAAGLAAAVAGGTSAQGQTADALIDKLVDKGVLSQREANELREEVDKDFTRAYQAKTGMKDWVTSLRMGGDFRGRWDHINSLDDVEGFSNRDRYRYRLRYGVNAVMFDNLEVGLRLASGTVNGNPVSRNQTMEDNGSLKGIGIDHAYARLSPFKNNLIDSTITVGKMPNPFVFSDLVFDDDYTPEGAALNTTFLLSSDHAIKFTAAAFSLDEVSTSAKDPWMLGAQARYDAKWSPKIETSAGVALLSLWREQNLSNAAVPNQQRGNTRTAGGILDANYNPVIADLGVTYNLESFPFYTGVFPIRVAGEGMYNTALANRNKGFSAGVTLGKSGKKKTWDLSYRYKYLQGDAWYEEVVDSNTGAIYFAAPTGGSTGYGAGTNIKGHIVKAQYSPYDSLTFAATYYLTRLIEESPTDSETGRLQVDLVWKF